MKKGQLTGEGAKMLSGLLLSIILAALGVGSPPCDEGYCDDGWEKASKMPGPFRQEYPFYIGLSPYKLVLDNMGLQGDYFAENKGDGRLRTLNPDDAWYKINDSTQAGTVIDSLVISNPPGAFNAVFTTPLRTTIGKSVTNHVWRREENGSWLDTGLVGPWLGSQSISEAGGVIMIAEYNPDIALTSSIFRSLDDGETWAPVLTVRSQGNSSSEIRHWHMVVPDPYFSHHWYAFSGDSDFQCRVFLSENDGDSWTEVTDLDGDQDSIDAAVHTQSLHRATSVWFTPDFIAWGTDDRIGGTDSRLIRTPRTTPLQLRVLGSLAHNHIRSATAVDSRAGSPLGWLLTTENQTGYDGIELVFVTLNFQIIHLGIIPGLNSTYFTSSLFEAEAIPTPDGWVFYTLARGFPVGYRTMRFTLIRDQEASRLESVPAMGALGLGVFAGMLLLVGARHLHR